MSRIPMPSPRRTNFAKLYLSGAAYDAATPKYIPNPAFDQAGRVSFREGFNKTGFTNDEDGSVSDTLLAFLAGKLSPEDLAVAKEIMHPSDAEAGVPDAGLASDAAIMASRRRLVAEGKMPAEHLLRPILRPQSAADIARRKEMFGDWDRLK